MWKFVRKNTIPDFGIRCYKDLEYDENRAFKSRIKNILLNEFGYTCYFTEQKHIDRSEFNIEHFVPRHKDKIGFKYDFWYDNLFLTDKNWNRWKGRNVDLQTTEKVFLQWLGFIQNFDEYFEFRSFPDIPADLAKELRLKNAFGEIRIVAKNQNPQVETMIKTLGLNDYTPTGRDSDRLSVKKYQKTQFDKYKS
jgi:hypothetical protein